MEHYILAFDDQYDCILKDEIPQKFAGISMNLGMFFDDLPNIKLTVKKGKLPNCIPNFQRYLYFDEKIRDIIAQFGIDFIQYFEVEVEYKDGEKVPQSYKLANVRNLVNAIDRNKSLLDIDADEEDEDSNIRDILDLQLNADIVKDEILFRMVGYETLLVVRADLAQAIVNSRCTGLEFYRANGYRV